MDTLLRYYGRLRRAAHCGTLHDNDIYVIETDDGWRSIVRRSTGTVEQCATIFDGHGPDLDRADLDLIKWSDSDAGARTKEWIATLCAERAESLRVLVERLRAPAPAELTEVAAP
jgi:hypothetical protein